MLALIILGALVGLDFEVLRTESPGSMLALERQAAIKRFRALLADWDAADAGLLAGSRRL